MPGHFWRWREFAVPVGDAEVITSTADGRPALLRRGQLDYLCGWPDPECLGNLLADHCQRVGIMTMTMPEGVRMRRAGNRGFAVNYSDVEVDLKRFAGPCRIDHGSAKLPPSGFAILTFEGRD